MWNTYLRKGGRYLVQPVAEGDLVVPDPDIRHVVINVAQPHLWEGGSGRWSVVWEDTGPMSSPTERMVSFLRLAIIPPASSPSLLAPRWARTLGVDEGSSAVSVPNSHEHSE